MKDFFKVATPAEVLAFVPEFEPLSTESVPVPEALGRVTAQDILSPVNLPDFSRSTMDGFAVMAQDTTGASEGSPIEFNLMGEVLMGEVPKVKVGAGQAARIYTGGMMPDGADAVVMDEYVNVVDDSLIGVMRVAAPGGNMIHVGQDIAEGQVVIHAGDVLRPQELGALSGLGITEVTVYRKPRVAIFATGDEIVDPSENPGPGQIRDINRFTLSALTTEAGGISVPLGIVKDDEAALKEKVRGALESCDMVLLSGGSSMGRRDYSVDVINSMGAPGVLIHGVSIKPGKPLIFGRVGKKPVIGVPGHPASNMMVFQVFIKPVLHRIGGRPLKPSSPLAEATLTRNVPSAPGREDYIRVRLEKRDGKLLAHPVLGSSGMISTMVKADGFIIIGFDEEGVAEGKQVPVYSF